MHVHTLILYIYLLGGPKLPLQCPVTKKGMQRMISLTKYFPQQGFQRLALNSNLKLNSMPPFGKQYHPYPLVCVDGPVSLESPGAPVNIDEKYPNPFIS